MFQDLCSIGSKTRLLYTATVSDIVTEEKEKFVILKGIMLDGVKMLRVLKTPLAPFKAIKHLRKNDLVCFTATVKQLRKQPTFLSNMKPNYVEYEYTLVDLAKVDHINKEIKVKLPEGFKDLPIPLGTKNVSIKHPFKLTIMINACCKQYRLQCGEEEMLCPINYSFDQIKDAWIELCKDKSST